MDLRKRFNQLVKDKNYARTGSFLLDLVIGGGLGLGIPFGKMINIVGDKSTGKTFLAWEIIANNYAKFKENLRWNYDDAEVGNTFLTENLYGVDLLNHEHNAQLVSSTVEEFDGNTSLFLDTVENSKDRGLYVLDSLDSLSDVKKQEREEEFKKFAESGTLNDSSTYNMGVASHLSKEYFRTKARRFADKNSLLIMISQTRQKIGAGKYEKSSIRSGGNAMDFYAHTCLWLYPVTKIKKTLESGEERVVGYLFRAVTEKNKTPRPYRQCIISVYFDYGTDDIGSCVDFLFDLRGKSGNLLASAKDIPWKESEKGVSSSLTNIKKWLKDIGKLDMAKKACKEKTGKAYIEKDWLVEYINKDPDMSAKAQEYFSTGYTRDELIDAIDKDSKMLEELHFRVFEKWEKQEESLLTQRKGKNVTA